MQVENEYVKDRETGDVTQVGTKGGDEVDYIYDGTIHKNNKGEITGAAYRDNDIAIVVQNSYSSGIDTRSTQDSNPTPGSRQLHGSTPVIFQAGLVLTGEALFAKLGAWLWGARTAEVSATTSTALVSTAVRYGSHTAEQMAARNVTPKIMQKTIENGVKYFDPKNGSIVYVLKNGMASGKGVAVATNPVTGFVKTVMTGKKVLKTRFKEIK